MVRALRQLCYDSPLNVTVFHPYFVFFDQVIIFRYHLAGYLLECVCTKITVFSVRTRSTDFHSIDGGRSYNHDDRFIHLHSERTLLVVGSVQCHFYRVGSSRIHGAVERQLGLYIHDQLNHVYRFLRRLHCTYLLRLHVIES